MEATGDEGLRGGVEGWGGGGGSVPPWAVVEEGMGMADGAAAASVAMEKRQKRR